MSSLRYLVLAAASLAVVVTMPHVKPRSLDLSDMINNTVCAIEVFISDVPNRIPQRIKMLKCAKQTDHWCTANKIPEHDCCHHKRNDHVMECVEMTDTVVVFNKDTQATETFDVSVGCTCMITQSTAAQSVPTGAPT